MAKMKALELLETSTIPHLRKLCFNTGTPCTGSKTAIIENLRENFSQKSVLEYATPNNGVNFNLLSIDMGIRNFAFAKIELNKRLPFNTPPLVKEWTKFDVNEWAGKTHKNSFEPAEYAKICSRLVDEVLLPKDETMPDAILIERQRARTGGSSVVQEWVFRVNMLEAMLHSLIYNRVQSEKCRVDIISTSPQRMGQFWKPEDHEEGRIKNSDTKKLRISLVDKWLNDAVYPKAGVRQMIQLEPTRFRLSKELAATSTKPQKWLNQVLGLHSEYAKLAGDGGKAKVDDLTDSLLHAISWLEWQHNRMILKLEMLSDLDNALSTSEKMYNSHFDNLKFLEKEKAKMKPKPQRVVKKDSSDSSKPPKKATKTETRSTTKTANFVPAGKEGSLSKVLIDIGKKKKVFALFNS